MNKYSVAKLNWSIVLPTKYMKCNVQRIKMLKVLFINNCLLFQPGTDSGCTAVVTLIRGNEVFVANAGDSRCVLCRNGKAVDLSFDHKPEDESERTRIEAAGGKVTNDGRVNGGLNLSRALGVCL